jgi:uncharacterized protein DUF6931
MSGTPTRRMVVDVAELSEEAAKVLDQRQRPEELFGLLVEKDLYEDAIRLAAHGLPKREAIWWACLCLWELYRPQPPAAADAALHAAVRWLREPTETHRRQAEAAGQTAGMNQPAGLVALAAFYSGGSITPPGQPEVAPKPELTGKLIATALLLALDLAPASMKPKNRKLFATLASQVGSQRLRWERPSQPPAPAR